MVNDVRQQRVRCDEQVPARYKDAKCPLSEGEEEPLHLGALRIREHRESWKRGALATVERWGNAPHAAAPLAQLPLLLVGVLLHPVWWVRHDGVDRAGGAGVEPRETLAVVNRVRHDDTCRRTREHVRSASRAHSETVRSGPASFATADSSRRSADVRRIDRVIPRRSALD